MPIRILDWVASRLHGVGFGCEIGVAFFRDQIEANKIIQRNLHGQWRENPEEFPVNLRNLTEESRSQLDVINRHMLLLTWIERMPPERLPVVEDRLGAQLATSSCLRQFAALRREVACIALRHPDSAS
jgi:hypothetical protein